MRVIVAADAHFADFVEQRTDALLTTAYLLTRDREAAQELVQEVLVSLYPRWRKVMDADSELAYVRRSVVNRFLSQRRRNLELVTDRIPDRSDGGDGQDRMIDRDQLRRILATLPERQRAAVVLRFFYDYSDQQIADAMDCRIGTVRSLISRALSTMRGSASDDSAEPHSQIGRSAR